MLVEVWSDVVCPWCYIGKRNLEAALARFDHPVEVRWRSFELDPSAPAVREGSYVDRLSSKYGVPTGEAQQMVERMTRAAAGAGLDFRFDIARPGNTFDAHRLIHLGGEPVKERLLRAYFTEGRPVGDRETLVELAIEAGLAEDEVRAVLDSDRYADEVRADEAEAAQLGVRGVPFFVVDRAYAASGAQPPDVLLEMLGQALEETPTPPGVSAP